MSHRHMIEPKLKQIPVFESEDDEREFWATHDSTEYIDWTNADRLTRPGLKREPTSQTPTLDKEMSLLSPRELEVFELLAQGATNKQISESLSISPNTVYTHIRHIQGKLRTANRTQTALLARAMSGRS